MPEHPLRSLRRGLERVRGRVHAHAREQVVQKQPAAVRIRGQIRGSRRRRRRRPPHVNLGRPLTGPAVPVLRRRGARGEPLAQRPGERGGVLHAPRGVVVRQLQPLLEPRGIRRGMRRGCIRRLGAVAASRGVRAERHEDVAEGLEDGAGAVGLVGGAGCAQRRRLVQSLLRGSKRGAAPFGDHLAILEVCLDAVWGGEVVVAAYLVDVVAHQLGHAVGDRGVEELMELGDVGGAVAGGRRGVRRRGGGADGGAGEDARLRASRVDDPELRNLGQVRGVARCELGERMFPRGERVPAERHPGALFRSLL